MRAPEKKILRSHSASLVREVCALHQLVLQAPSSRAKLSHKQRPAQDQP
jgi:hypothetical protein